MRRFSNESGVVALTAIITVGLTLIVAIPAGLIIVGQSSGCDDVIARITANEPVTQEEHDRCATAFPNQLSTAGLAANFIPTGADDAIVTQPMAALVDRASQPAPTNDISLPSDVTKSLTCGNGVKDPGEECDVTAKTIGCSGQSCVSCHCLTIPPFPECPKVMPSYLGDWEHDPTRGASHVDNKGYEFSAISAVCYYTPPEEAGLPAEGHLRFFAYAVHSGLDDRYLSGLSCDAETFRNGLDSAPASRRIIDTGEPDWFPVSSTTETLVSPDRCAAVTVIYYPTGGNGTTDLQWLRTHPRVVFEAHALAEQLYFKLEAIAFKR